MSANIILDVLLILLIAYSFYKLYKKLEELERPVIHQHIHSINMNALSLPSDANSVITHCLFMPITDLTDEQLQRINKWMEENLSSELKYYKGEEVSK